ncbi:insulinase family protein [Pseudobutyrivibrio sp.]|uniref:insulinase family protein n=1 Tax=Pseudobutyrivibrio sp. TaxID=2014367 RepID=UPI0025DF5A3D|nr:insulinase family protein [Pseudobutyrivibrio sp.]
MNKAYELLKEEKLEGIDSLGFIFEHKKTKARICFISNDDDNKVFYIGFRTPPKDSTGVAHIVEHTVLCGSDKYPVKDPFVELVKGSLNTFLNAMTYPDKTVYPIASTNDADYMNLIDVYMDAVFHPNIYKYREIFEQEGWHYEMETPESDLTINGVVYNEMKGAYSSPDDVLARQILNSLFPDTTYSIESGGDPKVIPTLTYEDFLAFHSKYYHPSNSYIYVYGDVDIDELLEYLDKKYLRHYDYLEVDSEIQMQKPFDKPVVKTIDYSISADQDTKNNAYLSYNVCIGDVLDPNMYRAFDILNYALVSAPGAPLYKALIDADIAEDVECSLESSQRQMYFSVVARGANEEDRDKFVEIIENTLRDVIKNSIDHKTLFAAINGEQFRARELDFGSAPKGLIIGLQLLDSWLYDKNRPFLHLHAVEVLNKIKSRVENGLFDYIADVYLLSNNHKSIVTLRPVKGLTSVDDNELKNKLAAKKAQMTAEEIQEIVEHTAYLKEYQQTPSSKNDLAKIPMLSRFDLTRKARPIDLAVHDVDGVTILHHKVRTNGIHYFNMVFDISDVTLTDIPYVSLLERFLGLFNTKNYTYTDYTNEMYLHTGGITTNTAVHEVFNTHDQYKITFEVRSKFIYDEADAARDLALEMILNTDFSDEKRLKELITAEKSHMEVTLNSRGNVVAATRARAGFSKKAKLADLANGVEFYRFLVDLEENFEAKKADIISRLNKLVQIIFSVDRFIISSTGKVEVLTQAKRLADDIRPRLNQQHMDFDSDDTEFEIHPVKEALKDASQIQYVAMAGDFVKAGFKYNGAFRLLNTILGYDYLWIKVRVQGGAYGCSMNSGRQGDLVLVSYRDPNLSETLNVYEKTGEYLRNFEADERDMTKYIIGTISGMDTPLTPSQRGLRGLSFYMSGITYEDIQKTRDEVLDATVEDIQALAEPVEAALDQRYICVIGNEDTIEANKSLFTNIESLY